MDTLRAPTESIQPPSLPPPTLGKGESHRPTRPAIPPPPLAADPSEETPAAGPVPDTVVLVATLDRASTRTLTRRLLGCAQVRSVRGEFELVYAIESHRHARPVVVIDGCVPSVDVETLAMTLGAVPRRPPVVLWGTTEATLAKLRRTSPCAGSWVRLEPTATDADVARVVQRLAHRRSRRQSGSRPIAGQGADTTVKAS